jgi:acetyl esterase/lipase
MDMNHSFTAGRVARACAGAAALAVGLSTLLGAQAAPAAVFGAFWAARNPQDAARAAETIAKSAVSFDAAVAALEQGRPYAAEVARGVVRASHTVDGIEFPYVIEVPQSYTPAKKYPVRVQLHGGVGRPDAAPRDGIGQLASPDGVEQIYVLPTAWSDAEWWTDRQLANLRAILDAVKRTYNVDENRVVLSGVSDGGTATYYFAMRDITPFASFLPLNGAVAVLRNFSLKKDGELFPNNLRNKPWFIVNGGRDPLYPPALVEPFVEHMIANGVEVEYRPQANGVHNTAWWPEVRGDYEAFVRAHPRNPLPDTLTWETDGTAGTGRADWLVIDGLAAAAPAGDDPRDLNNVDSGPAPDFGLRVNGRRVVSVGANSNASVFDFAPGDVIDTLNGSPVPENGNALEAIAALNPGTVLRIGVTRNGEHLELPGVLIAKGDRRTTPLFRHTAPWGRVDLTRSGNVVTATTAGVTSFTLLASPRQFDLSKPIVVVANGVTVFSGRVDKDLGTLMKWAARDNDRTMLFAAEIPVKVTR